MKKNLCTHFPVAALLKNNTTKLKVIVHVKFISARHSIPDVLMSDNGLQSGGHEFKQFAVMFEFRLVTASPNYLQANGLVENGVKIITTEKD